MTAYPAPYIKYGSKSHDSLYTTIPRLLSKVFAPKKESFMEATEKSTLQEQDQGFDPLMANFDILDCLLPESFSTPCQKECPHNAKAGFPLVSVIIS